MRKKNIKLHPALVLLFLTVFIMILSSIGSILHLETSYYTVNSVTGSLERNIVTIKNLFNRTGIQYWISNMIPNFINFVPLGTIIVGLMGVGVAYKSGFLNSLFKLISQKVPKKLITFLVVLIGIISSMFFETAYVIVIPLSAILFMNIGRHPSGGICASYAGITFGYGANLIVNGLDNILLKYTRTSTTILDQTYTVNTWGNIIITIISTFILAYVGMIITEKFIVAKLGRYTLDEDEEESIKKEITKKEIKGVIISLITILLASLILLYSLLPGLPFSGLLLDLKVDGYINQLFGPTSFFNQGAVFIFSELLILAGLVYGIRVKTIKNNRDLVNGMSYYLNSFSSIIVLIFFASQLCAIFKETNLGVFITVSLTELLENLNLTGLFLIIVAFLIIAISTIFVPAASTKWAIMAPVLVPQFMRSSFSPEFSQAVFRAADSTTKGISPFFTYFAILIGFLQIYNKKKNDTITLTDAIALMIPYTIAFTITWLLIIIGFYIIGLPIGIGVRPML